MLAVTDLPVIADVAPSSLTLSTLMMEAKRTSETSAPTRATGRHILENIVLHSRCRENLKSYLVILFCNFKQHRLCTYAPLNLFIAEHLTMLVASVL
jgi:hypothetical protein